MKNFGTGRARLDHLSDRLHHQVGPVELDVSPLLLSSRQTCPGYGHSSDGSGDAIHRRIRVSRWAYHLHGTPVVAYGTPSPRGHGPCAARRAVSLSKENSQIASAERSSGARLKALSRSTEHVAVKLLV
jgi:hypothetical protein